MKAVLAALLLLVTPATAETLSAEIGTKGIQPTLARLKAQPEPALEDRFAIGALQFLSGIERALQQQWRTGMDQAAGNVGTELGIPLFRQSLPSNPTPEPFSGALVSQIFTDVDADMQAAHAALAALPQGEEFGLEITLSDIWFDVNLNGSRDANEEAVLLLGPQLMGWRWTPPDPTAPPVIIRFDAADAAWLSAYTHVLSGVANAILAYDPAASIDRVLASNAAFGRTPKPEYDFFNVEDLADALGMLEGALNQQPDPDRAKAAKEHFLAMIADNRRFWAAVALETDNDREWLPNDTQTAAMGFTLPPGTGNTWLGVLADGEALLQGRLLMPYWRGVAGQGLNLGRMFDEPAPVSISGWIQGWAAVPYLEKGPVITGANLRRFEAMMGGNASLMMAFLN